MAIFTLDELVDTMTSCTGIGGATDVVGDIADTPFSELDYDSLALLELSVRLENRLHIRMSDDAVSKFRTPSDVLDYVNQLMVEA